MNSLTSLDRDVVDAVQVATSLGMDILGRVDGLNAPVDEIGPTGLDLHALDAQVDDDNGDL